MIWYQWLAIVSAIICLASLLIQAVKLISYGKPKEFAQKRGNTRKAIRYSYTGAMSPTRKESAYMNLPTYTAGLLYHLGTFLSLVLFILFISGFYPSGLLSIVLEVVLIISGVSGLGILIKRMAKQQLRALSNPDDYISNLLVSLVQLMTALMLLNYGFAAAYFILISLLFIYLPLGKLRHTIYFFAARYQLGFFYGWRGVWPPKQG